MNPFASLPGGTSAVPLIPSADGEPTYKVLFRSSLTTANALARIAADLDDSPELRHLVAFTQSSERGLAKYGRGSCRSSVPRGQIRRDLFGKPPRGAS